MKSAGQYKNDIYLEKYSERIVVQVVRGESFTHSVKLNGCATSLTVIDKKGEPITIKVKEIIDKDTWSKFFDHAVPAIELGWLAYEAGKIAARYVRFLRTEHTERFRYIKSNDEVLWLKKVALIAVLWHMANYKYATHQFMDDWAENEMSKIRDLREYCRNMNKAVNHGVKDPEQARELIEKVYAGALALIENRKMVSYEQLPMLPPGTPDPLALPEEETDEEKFEQAS